MCRDSELRNRILKPHYLSAVMLLDIPEVCLRSASPEREAHVVEHLTGAVEGKLELWVLNPATS